MKKVYKELVAVVGIAVTTAILFNAIFFVPIRLPWDAYYHVSRIENLRQSGLAFLYPFDCFTDSFWNFSCLTSTKANVTLLVTNDN